MHQTTTHEPKRHLRPFTLVQLFFIAAVLASAVLALLNVVPTPLGQLSISAVVGVIAAAAGFIVGSRS